MKLFDWTDLGSVADLSATRLLDPANGVTNLQSQGTEVIDGTNANRDAARRNREEFEACNSDFGAGSRISLHGATTARLRGRAGRL